MSEYTPLSEDLLIMLGAYVDGELTEDERAAVEDMANKDPRIAEELEGLFALNNDLRDVFNGLLEKPVPAEIIEATKPTP
ncbi:anti-sigma factor family protein, partial [Planktotalea frisia]